MSTRKSWLDALKKTIEEEIRSPREYLKKSTAATVQNVQKSQEAEQEASDEVVDLDACTLRGENDRRLLAAGWSPKDRCGPLELTIWANPETGFYCSQEVALHRLDQDTSAGDGV